MKRAEYKARNNLSSNQIMQNTVYLIAEKIFKTNGGHNEPMYIPHKILKLNLQQQYSLWFITYCYRCCQWCSFKNYWWQSCTGFCIGDFNGTFGCGIVRRYFVYSKIYDKKITKLY